MQNFDFNAGCCENGKEPLGSKKKKGGEFLAGLSDYWHLKRTVLHGFRRLVR
jgi:hypothetical protein